VDLDVLLGKLLTAEQRLPKAITLLNFCNSGCEI
jgi:hypothetical protein